MNATRLGQLTAVLALSLTLSYPAQAQMTITEQTEHSVFKGLFLTVWARLKAIQPGQRVSATDPAVCQRPGSHG
jgi:hypothetical protein